MENEKLVRLSDVRLIESNPNAYPEDWNEYYEQGFCDAINAVLDIPAVDAVEVVRCLDCKHHDGVRCWNWNSTIVTRFEDFCSNGERREDGDGDG